MVPIPWKNQSLILSLIANLKPSYASKGNFSRHGPLKEGVEGRDSCLGYPNRVADKLALSYSFQDLEIDCFQVLLPPTQSCSHVVSISLGLAALILYRSKGPRHMALCVWITSFRVKYVHIVVYDQFPYLLW